MANADRPRGLQPVGTTDGGDYHGKIRTVAFLDTDATATFIGDAVALTGDSTADGEYEVVTQAAAGDAIVGAVVSFLPNFEDEGSLTSVYRKANQARLAKVVFGTDVLYEIQEDSDGGALDATASGSNVDLIVGAGDTFTGLSGMEIQSSSVGTGTAQLRLRRIARYVDNELGDNAVWVVNINENQDDHGAGV